MKLNGLEFFLVNNALRAASQRQIETPRLIGPRGSLAGKRVLEIGPGWLPTPPMRPVPPNVASAPTVRAPAPVPLPEALFTMSEPAETVAPPVQVLAALRVSLPVPILFSSTKLLVTAVLLLMLPLKVTSRLLPPMR